MIKIIAEYIWLGGNNEFLSKTRVIYEPHVTDEFNYFPCVYDIPLWDYDGSSTGQATTKESEVILKPCAVYKNPFFKNIDAYKRFILVLCETYNQNNEPLENNYRASSKRIFDQCIYYDPWFGLEQEYFIFPKNDENRIENFENHYCNVSKDRKDIYRKIMDEHLLACLDADLKISGMNKEVVSNQYEFQIGPVTGIDAPDQLMMGRYLLERIAQSHDMIINWNPKPFCDVNGSGCHVNFSTNKTRGTNGIRELSRIIFNLGKMHKQDIEHFGEGNEKRLTGNHETSDVNTFSYGVGDRTCSIRISNAVNKSNKGYLEDRRPASNMNPYLVCGLILRSVILYDENNEEHRSLVESV